MIGCSPERYVIARGRVEAKRLHYSLKQIGAIAKNKSQGETLLQGIAVNSNGRFKIMDLYLIGHQCIHFNL